MTTAKYSKIAIIGPGLLGGSLLLALKSRNLAQTVSVWARRAEPLKAILSQHLAQQGSQKIEEVVEGADLVILCTPIGTMLQLAQDMLSHIKEDAIITDVGSVKTTVETSIAPLFLEKGGWIGSHPMAGSEQSGLEAARADLFVNATIVLTPTTSTKPGVETKAGEFWQSIGGRVISFTPEVHDQLVAQISHLPHLLASLLVNATARESFAVAGPGFRDTTRVAASPAEMWAEILLSNRDAVLDSLNAFLSHVEYAKSSLENKDLEALQEMLTKASEVRKFLTF